MNFKLPKFSRSTLPKVKTIFYGTPTRLRLLSTLLVLGLLIGIPITYAVMTYTASLQTNGTSGQVAIGLFSDSGLTQPFSVYGWGNIIPGQTLSRIVYVKNTGNIGVTLNVLYVWANATQAQYFTTSSNYAGQTISSGSSIPVTINLLAGADLSKVPTWAFRIDFVATNV
jgi:hypothetical protein